MANGAGEGWERLREGDWEGARASFAGALAAGETGAALEGLSWAAWWLDDADAVFDARERAYRRYRADGDAAAAARMATWLAADELDFRGAAAVASGWLQRAARLLGPLPPCPEHGWLAFHEGYVAFGAGERGRGPSPIRSSRAGARCGTDAGRSHESSSTLRSRPARHPRPSRD